MVEQEDRFVLLFVNGEKCKEGAFSPSLSEDIDGRWFGCCWTMARVFFDIPNCSRVGVEGKALKSIFLLADL